jgi:hypothetical protein
VVGFACFLAAGFNFVVRELEGRLRLVGLGLAAWVLAELATRLD